MTRTEKLMCVVACVGMTLAIMMGAWWEVEMLKAAKAIQAMQQQQAAERR